MQKKQHIAVSIEAYIQQFGSDVQDRLRSIRAALHAAIPHAKEGIKYGMPTLMLGGKNVVHFAAMKNHIGFYPAPSGIASFQTELTPYPTSKGAIQFPYDKRLPIGLIKRIAGYRAREVRRQLAVK